MSPAAVPRPRRAQDRPVVPRRARLRPAAKPKPSHRGTSRGPARRPVRRMPDHAAQGNRHRAYPRRHPCPSPLDRHRLDIPRTPGSRPTRGPTPWMPARSPDPISSQFSHVEDEQSRRQPTAPLLIRQAVTIPRIWTVRVNSDLKPEFERSPRLSNLQRLWPLTTAAGLRAGGSQVPRRSNGQIHPCRRIVHSWKDRVREGMFYESWNCSGELNGRSRNLRSVHNRSCSSSRCSQRKRPVLAYSAESSPARSAVIALDPKSKRSTKSAAVSPALAACK